MPHRMVLALALIAAATTPVPALADKAAAGACANGLSPDARLIYEEAYPGVAAGGDLVGTIRQAATGLVKGGRIPRNSARSAAQEAGACLKRL
ncbi:hypothetical protein [Propylenella binzhouense]|uniref:Uncharacterized protein n=1 Tax=Propylenella binzhouense TaxID=2555902 RepID=A0A964T433_9HYPH|nr:hypothetical protein [Propylenella binzhouense]MYZ48073.1 hypothetical protein [Propylenella binzhouense]